MKTKIVYISLITVLTSFIFLGFNPSSYAQGPGAAWQYYRVITLSPVTPAVNFQVEVTLASGQYTNMNSDGSDLRFYDNADNNCQYWIESWNTGGTSTIWVKVPASGANALIMYYGNSLATSASSGDNTFDFFDDFTSALGSKWTTGGTVTQSGSNVTLSNTNGTTAASLSNTSAFTPSSSSFLLETKHYEVGYNRNRFYATTASGGNSPLELGANDDYGYFSTLGTAQTSAQVFWGSFPGTTSVSNNTNYLTQWRITDGSTYNWYTYNYATGATVTNGSRTTTYGSNIRYISISVTEVASTSTIVDWVRVRQYTATEPAGTVGNQTSNTAATTPYVYNSSGIFIVPSGVTSITVQTWGGGGGGGRAATDSNGKGGGGGGAYSSSTLSPVIPGNVYTVTVGSGGTGGTSGANGTDGGQSSFGSLVIAVGGTSGNNGTGTSVASAAGGAGGLGSSGTGTTRYSGGNGGNGNTATGGTGGGGGASGNSSGTVVNGANGIAGGAGGNGPDGDGGAGGLNNNSGSNGTPPGGGGGGRGDVGAVSGNGAPGQVIISWCVPPSAPGVVSPVFYCQNATASQLTASGSGLLWYTTPTGGTGSPTAPTPSTTAVGTTSYYVSQTVGCEGPRAQIDVIVRQLPSASASKTDIKCFNAGDGTITVTGSGGSGSYSYSINNGSNYYGSNIFGSLSPGAYKIRVKDGNGCESPAIP